ncbi:MAG: hypothetical protein AAGI01_10875 [Myxococcota bacterium]
MNQLWTESRAALVWVVCLGAALSVGCQREPEDLEKWRDAKGGEEKIVGWAISGEESMEVRKRAVEIAIEDNYAAKLEQELKDVSDEAVRTELAAAAVPVIERMWATQDMTKLEGAEGKANDEGRIAVKQDGQSIRAKDAAYYMHPYVGEADRAKLEAVMASWLSTDHKIRDGVGVTTLGQLLPRSGPEGFEGMMEWFRTHDDPNFVARIIRGSADGAVKTKFAAVIKEIAEEKHPEISPSLRTAILETSDPVILPYLERAILDESSAPEMVDDAQDALVRIQGAKSTPFFAKLVAEKQGLMRWVAVTRLIELRGRSGVFQAVNALPLETGSYVQGSEKGLEAESEYFCNFVKTELAKQEVTDIEPIFAKMLDTPRWPAQFLGARCAEQHKLSGLEAKVAALERDKQSIPGYGEAMTLGRVAKKALAAL